MLKQADLCEKAHVGDLVQISVTIASRWHRKKRFTECLQHSTIVNFCDAARPGGWQGAQQVVHLGYNAKGQTQPRSL